MNTPIATQASAAQFDPTKLSDIHLPEAIGFWPVAPGWWILLAVFFFIILFIVLFNKRKPDKKSRSVKKLKLQAMSELQAIRKAHKKHGIDQKMVQQLSVFLRRYALSLYHRDGVASLTDEHWLDLLDNMFAGQIKSKQAQHEPFRTEFAELLTKAPYQSVNATIDREKLLKLYETTQKLIETCCISSHFQESKPKEPESV